MISMESMGAISIPITAPAAAGAIMIVAIVTIMMSSGPIFMMLLPFKKCFTHDQGLLPPLTSHKWKLGSIIQLIVRNVKRIFMRGYILQIAVLIAASGAFGDQIK